MRRLIRLTLSALSVALVLSLPATPTHAHKAASTCAVHIKKGYAFVHHVKDGEALYLAIDGVANGRIYRGRKNLPAGTKSAYVYLANGTQICSG